MASPVMPVMPSSAIAGEDKASREWRYIDIGINLADPIFKGVYHGKQRHADDMSAVVKRAQEVGCSKMIVTGSDFASSRAALELAREYPGTVYTTAGIHPCSSSIFSTAKADADTGEHSMPCDPDPAKPMAEDHEPCLQTSRKVMSDLEKLVGEGRRGALVALGEFGLDYDRLHYCSKRVQLHSFASQLDLALTLTPQLPLFLHSRAAHADFVGLLKAKFGDRLERLTRGAVVHSFTGTSEEVHELMDLGLYIGTNGCSFKTAENCAVVKEIRLDRLMLETDGPWCEVRPSHEGWKYLLQAPNGQRSGRVTADTAKTGDPTAPPKQRQKEAGVAERWKTVKKEKWVEGAMVKGRNEPCMIVRVADIVAAIKGLQPEAVCEAAWENTVKLFGLPV